jgi:tetratricopeptide (TPR) repeat protein
VSTVDPAKPGGTAARRAARAGSGARPSSAGASQGSRPPADRASSGGGTAGGRGDAATRRRLDPDTLAALEEERDFLLRSLDDLEREHDAGDVDDTDYAELKDDYTARAARVLRAIDDRRSLAAARRPARSTLRTAVGLLVVAVLAVGAGWLVFHDSGTRAPGQGLSGDTRQDSANLLLQAQQFTGQAQQALQQGDSQGALDDFESAIKTYDKALELSPGNVEAMTYRGWVLHTIAVNSSAQAGAQLDDQARQWLDEAVAADPTYADARVFRAILERNAGDFAAAQADLDALDVSQIPQYMQSMVEQVRTEVQAGLAGATPTTGG